MTDIKTAYEKPMDDPNYRFIGCSYMSPYLGRRLWSDRVPPHVLIDFKGYYEYDVLSPERA